jgi:hypothetical protein
MVILHWLIPFHCLQTSVYYTAYTNDINFNYIDIAWIYHPDPQHWRYWIPIL